jgi:hypothetical protein
MNKKIGIITHHWAPNFGANLQALSTVSYLRSKGFEPEIIDYRPAELVSIYVNRIPELQRNEHQKFVDEFLPLTAKSYGSLAEIAADESLKDFDHIFAGSDALFRLLPKRNREDLTFPNPFWLNWLSSDAQKKGKASFLSVSSMGTNYKGLPVAMRKAIGEHLSSFPKISVRDGWTRKMVESLTDSVEVVETVDPVFLLNDYFDIPKEYQVTSDKDYVLLCPNKSDVSAKWLKGFQEEAHKNNLTVVGFPNPEGFPIEDFVDEQVEYPIHPLRWYSYIASAKGYVGTRFHPIISCLENGVPFVSLDQYHRHPLERGRSKTYDICRKMGKTDYCIGKRMIPLYSPKTIFRKLLDPNQRGYEANMEAEKKNLISYLESQLP